MAKDNKNLIKLGKSLTGFDSTDGTWNSYESIKELKECIKQLTVALELSDKKLEVISRDIEKWCMDDYPDNIGQEELTPSLEAIYNIATGSLDSSIDNFLHELDVWDRYKEINERNKLK